MQAVSEKNFPLLYQNIFISKFDPENTDIKKKKRVPSFLLPG